MYYGNSTTLRQFSQHCKLQITTGRVKDVPLHLWSQLTLRVSLALQTTLFRQLTDAPVPAGWMGALTQCTEVHATSTQHPTHHKAVVVHIENQVLSHHGQADQSDISAAGGRGKQLSFQSNRLPTYQLNAIWSANTHFTFPQQAHIAAVSAIRRRKCCKSAFACVQQSQSTHVASVILVRS